jgi:hypothetical protein
MNMSHFVALYGMPGGWKSEVEAAVIAALAANGITYQINTCAWFDCQITTYDLQGNVVNGSPYAIVLPSIPDVLANWKKVLLAVSASCENIVVSVFIPGEGTKVALNGNQL